MKIKFILFFALSCKIVLGQDNLVHNGDFEFTGDAPMSNIWFNNELYSNPEIPCSRPTHVYLNAYNNSGNYSEYHWHTFGAESNNNGNGKPDIFDSRYFCNVNNQTNSCSQITQNNSGINCNNDVYKVGIPNNFYGTQHHYNNINNIPGRYVGLKSGWFGNNSGGFAIDRDPGIYIKLKKPLKCGYVYHLKFNAVCKAGTNKTLRIRLGTGDRWHQDNVLINGTTNTINVEITEDGGSDNIEWQNVDIPIFVDEPNVQWLFIRAPNATLPWQFAKILLDDISLIDQCAIDNACDPTLYSSTDEITTNGFHNMNQPLTFINTNSSKNVKIQIFSINNQTTPIRTIEITDPGSNIAWDGKNDFGATVANGPYRYEITYGGACSCRFSNGIFIKNGNPELFNVTFGTDINSGALTFYNLNNVHEFDLKIFNSSGALVYQKFLFNPPNEIHWNGTDDAGNPAGAVPAVTGCGNPTQLYFDLTVKNNCGNRLYEGVNFIQYCFGNNLNTTISDFSYIQQSKPPENCVFSFDYTSYAKAPIPCCDSEIDLFLEDKYISGIQEFKLIRDIQAGPKVVIKTNSDIKFLAGNEIRLVQDFYTEPAAEFLARIEPCTRMISDDGPVEIMQWTNIPDIAFENTVKIETDTINILNVYPNPTTNDLFIQSEIGMSTIEVFDLTGKLMASEACMNNKLVKLQMSSLLNGIYILQITLEDGSMEVRKVIKN